MASYFPSGETYLTLSLLGAENWWQFADTLSSQSLKNVSYNSFPKVFIKKSNPSSITADYKYVLPTEKDDTKAVVNEEFKLEDLGIKESGLDALVKEAYRILGLCTFFTAGEQEFYAEKGFVNEPQRCKACRDARKNATRGEREWFEATCDSCGGVAKVPFKPREDRPVYCSECFAKKQEQA